MLGRKTIFAGMLGTAVGAPYLVTNADNASEAASNMWGQMFQQSAPVAAANPYSAEAATAQTEPLDPRIAPRSEMPLEGLETHDLSDVLRFDVSPAWVYRRWARKSTALSELDLYGVRVPLVTGTGVDDLAGSLTYYFGSSGGVERLSFRGRTGDARKLIALVVSRFGLRRQQPEMPGELLYEVRWNGKAMSRLRVTPASVIWASSPHATYAVELDLNRPGAGRYLQETPVETGPIPTHPPLHPPRAPL